MIGKKIQNYNIEELLGEGGMGIVYRATDTVLQRTVAIKVLHQHLIRDTTFFQRFRNEAVLSAKLHHPNVAILYSLLQEKGESLMIMEYIDGQNLEKVLKTYGALPVDLVLKIIIQAIDGLQHAHEKDILHRDIKPANLMLTKNGTVKLMDFGIARIIGSQRLTRVDRILGTVEYMAPELLDGSEASVQSDLYAVGVLMYELLSGKMPFEANTDATLITQILTKKPIPLHDRVSNLPKKVAEILDKLLQKKPEKRFANVGELRESLGSLVTPGKVILPVFQAKMVEIPETKLFDKSKNEPTKLDNSRHFTGKSTVLEVIKGKVFTNEGMILGGSAIVAILILVFGISFFSKKEKESQQNFITPTTQIIIPEPIKKDSVIVSQVAIIEPVQKKEESIQIKQKEERNKTPKEEKKIEPISKKEPEKPIETPVYKPVETTKEPVKEEVKPIAKTIKQVTLKNMTVALVLDETISSNDANIVHKVVSLRVLDDVRIDGIVVFRAGNTAKGYVSNARSTDKGKSFLEFKPELIQAVNGEWVSLKSPTLGRSGSSLEPVIFTKGTRISPDTKVVNTTLNISQ